MGIFAGDDSTPFAPLRKIGTKPDEKHRFEHAAGFGNEIQTFSADFTTDRRGYRQERDDGDVQWRKG